MADLKTLFCALGALGWLSLATSCDPPLEQCLQDYVCQTGTCSERFDKYIACVQRNLTTLCPQVPQFALDELVKTLRAEFNGTLCSDQFWDISSYVTSHLDTRGKCSERYNQEYAGCSRSFLQLRFLQENASADNLCREYQRSLDCITELSMNECCFNQSEQAILFAGTESNPFCQCANVMSPGVAMATERPNNMAATFIPFSRGCPTRKPTSSSIRPSFLTPLMIFNLVFIVFCLFVDFA
ncbi:uncharacterized protein LOC144859831 [Branchiostoma floridae x Branchiostoma japonicum]